VRASATRAWRGPRLVNIFSIPGSGKSALVIHVGQALSAEYPDCQIYFNLRSSDQQPVSVDSLLGNKLVELGLPVTPGRETVDHRGGQRGQRRAGRAIAPWIRRGRGHRDELGADTSAGRRACKRQQERAPAPG
jgi:predicted ATPase